MGLRGRPAGNIAVIILSDMHNTIIWDVHQGGFPDCMRDFFANEKLFKGGVRVGPKGAKLKKQFGAEPVQLAELSIIAHTLGLLSDEEKERVSMRMMTQNVLQVPVRAWQRMRCCSRCIYAVPPARDVMSGTNGSVPFVYTHE